MSEEESGMSSANVYNVTEWAVGDPYEDIGAVINSIIADIKHRQGVSDLHDEGKPGAVIYIPPGDFRLVTQVLIDISFLRIVGSGHGFTSSSIRFNTPVHELKQLRGELDVADAARSELELAIGDASSGDLLL
jgi:inulin fructotransferase (DFA-I-forming)